MSVLIPHELKQLNVFDKGKTVMIMKSPRVINVIYEAKRTIEGVKDLLPHHTHCPYYIHRTENFLQVYSWFFILEYR